MGKYAYEPQHNKTNKMAFAPSEDWDQPGHPPSLIRLFAVSIKKATHWAHSEDWSHWPDAQADPSLRWAHSHFVGFDMRRLIYIWSWA